MCLTNGSTGQTLHQGEVVTARVLHPSQQPGLKHVFLVMQMQIPSLKSLRLIKGFFFHFQPCIFLTTEIFLCIINTKMLLFPALLLKPR